MACSCCGGNGCDGFFGERFARRTLRRYLRRGLGAEARLMAAWSVEEGLEGASVLEVGGGVGALQAELVRRGASAGTVVEVVPSFESYARELARRAGIEERTSFVLADLAVDAGAVAPADIVALRRVVCCSPHGPALLGAAAALTQRLLVASYPRRTRATRAAVRLQNALLAVARKQFRVFVHDPVDLEAAAAAHGLRRTRTQRGLVWETAAFARSASR